MTEELETLEAQVTDMTVSGGGRMMRAENDSLIQLAQQRPRVPKRVLAASLAEIKVVPEEAGTMFYMIPYKDNRTNRVTNVTGLSIKAAQLMARQWGNCMVTGKLVDEDDDGALVEGSFIDAETGYRYSKQMKVSKWIKKRGGETVKLDDQKMLQAINSGMSKAVRNAVLGALPAWFTNKVFEASKKTAQGGKNVLPGLIAGFASMGVTEEMLINKVGCQLKDATPDQIGDLMGFGQAIRDKQTTVAAVFEHQEPEKVVESNPEGPGITVEDLMQGKAEPPVESEDDSPPAPKETPIPASEPASTRKISW